MTPCLQHPERAVDRACERCGDFVCPECLGARTTCAPCLARLGKPISVPWENPAVPLATRFALTLLRGLFRPRALFSDGADRSPYPSFAFGIPGGILGCFGYSFFEAEHLLGGIARATTHVGLVAETFAGLTLSAGALLLLTALIQHFLCWTFGSRRSLDATLRVAFYVSGSVAWIIPVAGLPVAFVWYHAAAALALREVHGRGAYPAALLAIILSAVAGVGIAVIASQFI